MKFLEFLKLSESYIGSCVDVGSDNGYEICNIFSDATEMSNKVYDPNEDDPNDSKEISKEDFEKYVRKNSIKPKMISKDAKYFYIGSDLKIDSAKIFYIYNPKTDIHYFFRRSVK